MTTATARSRTTRRPLPAWATPTRSAPAQVDSQQSIVHSIDDIINSLPSRLEIEKANKVELNLLFEFENELNYLIEIKDNKLTSKRIDHRPSTIDLTITTTTQTYINVETGKLNPQEAFMSGKIQVSDLGKMLQFGSLFKKLSNEVIK